MALAAGVTLVFGAYAYRELGRTSPRELLAAFSVLAVLGVFLWRHGGGDADVYMRQRSVGLVESWRRRRAGLRRRASENRRTSSAAIHPEGSFQAWRAETHCVACQKPLPRVALICSHCDALVNPRWFLLFPLLTFLFFAALTWFCAV